MPPTDSAAEDRHRRFDTLFAAHYAGVRAYVRRRGHADLVDDAVAETFVVAWRRLDVVPEDALPWLLAVARRVLANQRRAADRRSALVTALGHLLTEERRPKLEALGATYALGGVALLEHTLTTQVIPSLRLDHVIDVSYGGLDAIAAALGCVWGDVDRAYAHATPVEALVSASLHLQPGYQRLCGRQIVNLFLFRHEDSDVERVARARQLVRWVQQSLATESQASRARWVSAFEQSVQTDAGLHREAALVDFAESLAASSPKPLNSVPFPGHVSCPPVGRPCYFVGEPAADTSAYSRFLTPGLVPALPRFSAHVSATGLVPDEGDGRAQAAALSDAALPILYPGLIVRGSTYCTTTSACIEAVERPNQYPRAYSIKGPNGEDYRAYRMTLAMGGGSVEYYGVQGTTWADPPILRSSTPVTIDGRRLLLVADGARLTTVGWRHDGVTYWVSNTLAESISNRQLLAIAASLQGG